MPLNTLKIKDFKFFTVKLRRYERTSTIITTNKAFEELDDIFGDETVAAAILDRLLHHSYPFFINGKSYRIKELYEKMDVEKNKFFLLTKRVGQNS